MRNPFLDAVLCQKIPIKLVFGLVIGLFCFFGLLVPVFADTPFEDDFENYNLGQIVGQGNWQLLSGTSYSEVVDTEKKEGTKSLQFFQQAQNNYKISKTGDVVSIGSLGFWVKIKDADLVGSSNNRLFIDLKGDVGNSNTMGLYLQGASHSFQLQTNNGWIWIGDWLENTWIKIDYEWDNIARQRINFNGEGWSDWIANGHNTFIAPDRIGFNFVAFTLPTDFFIDYIAETSEIPSCSLGNCDLCADWFDCQVAGCCWHYNPYFMPTNYCGDCDLECGIENCGSCYTQADCETAGCYWTGDYCAGIFGECGDGLACQFCSSQADCETAGCYWSGANQSCWYKVSESPIVFWTDYYADNGGYENPLPFVNNLASASAGIFASVSEMLNAFETSFDAGQALANGNAFGNAIPKARGYLTIIDNFFGTPVAEIFLIVIIFILAVGLFRIIRGLIGLVKI